MKKTIVGSFIIALLFNAQALMAYEGHLSTAVYKDENSAVAAAKTLMNEIDKGRVNATDMICQNSFQANQTATGFKVMPVWIDEEGVLEKQYVGKVGYTITCTQ